MTKGVTLLLATSGYFSGKPEIAQNFIIVMIIVEVVILTIASGLIINITWSTPQLILACGAMAFVDVEFQGPTSNFSRTYKQSPVRIDERLPIGKYTYTITKKPVTGCSNFTPIVKTGTFTINSCPALCGNATSLRFTLD